jgi:hypothetical protein
MVIDDQLRAELLVAVPAICLLSGTNGVHFGIGQARAVADWFADRGFIILGFEGFRCDGAAIEPLAEFIADFSSIAGSAEHRANAAREAALRVLPLWSGTVEFVEFVFDE